MIEPDDRTRRIVVLIACEKLNLEEAALPEVVMERDQPQFSWRVAIPGQAIVAVTDEEIYRRRRP